MKRTFFTYIVTDLRTGKEITVYRVEMEDGTQMRCAVTTWFTNLSIDCDWP